MGREVRKVPPNWNHPRTGFNRGLGYQPMFDETFEDGLKRWEEEKDEGDAPPSPDYFRPWKDGEGTWYQVWETLSEGTPVTPPFETKEELIDYLVDRGDFWDQEQGRKPWARDKAEKLVNGRGSLPTLVLHGEVPHFLSIFN